MKDSANRSNKALKREEFKWRYPTNVACVRLVLEQPILIAIKWVWPPSLQCIVLIFSAAMDVAFIYDLKEPQQKGDPFFTCTFILKLHLVEDK